MPALNITQTIVQLEAYRACKPASSYYNITLLTLNACRIIQGFVAGITVHYKSILLTKWYSYRCSH